MSIIDQMTIDEGQQENVELQVDQEPEENTSDKSWKDSFIGWGQVILEIN